MSDDNPFAALSDGGRDGGGGAQTKKAAEVDFVEVLTRGFTLITENLDTLLVPIVVLLAVGLASFGLNFAVSFGAEMSGDPTMQLGGQLTGNVIQIVFGLINLYLILGLYRMLLRLDRGQQVEQDAMWGEGGNFLSAFGANLLVGLAVGLLLLPSLGVFFMGVFGGTMAAIESGDFTQMLGLVGGGMLGAMLLSIPAMLLFAKLQFATVAVVDMDANPIDAIGRAWEVTNEHLLLLFFQFLLLAVIQICLSLFTCGLAAPIGTVISASVLTVTYNAMKANAGL